MPPSGASSHLFASLPCSDFLFFFSTVFLADSLASNQSGVTTHPLPHSKRELERVSPHPDVVTSLPQVRGVFIPLGCGNAPLASSRRQSPLGGDNAVLRCCSPLTPNVRRKHCYEPTLPCSKCETEFRSLQRGDAPRCSKCELERALCFDVATWQHLPAFQPLPQMRDGDSHHTEPPMPRFLVDYHLYYVDKIYMFFF
jgi:hypothetical protein